MDGYASKNSPVSHLEQKSVTPISKNSPSISDLDSFHQDNLDESIYDDPSELINFSDREVQQASIQNEANQFVTPCKTLPSEKADEERLKTLRPRTQKPNYMPWKLSLSTAEADNDPNSFEDAMSRPDKELWLKAMDEEIESLHKNNVWQLVAFLLLEYC